MENSTGILNRALDALIKGEFKDATQLLNGNAFKQAMQAEQSDAIRRDATKIQQALLNLSSEEARPWLERSQLHKPLERYADNDQYATMKAIDFVKEKLAGKDGADIDTAARSLDTVIKDINRIMTEQSTALTVHEKGQYNALTNGGNVMGKLRDVFARDASMTDRWDKLKQVGQGTWGALRYEGALIKDRWTGSHAADETVVIGEKSGLFDNAIDVIPTVQEQTKKANQGKVNLNSIGGTLGQNLTEAVQEQPAAEKLREVTLDGKSLGQFSKISALDTRWKKGKAIGITALGTGLVVHGARNVMCSFNPKHSEHLQVEELGQSKERKGVNWGQLAVGTAETVLGVAVMHRELAGRWGLGAVEGHVERF